MAWSYSLKNLLTVFGVTILAVGSVECYQCTVQECQSTSCPGNTNVCTATNGCFNQIQKFDTPSLFTDHVFKQKGCTKESSSCSNHSFSATLGDQRRFTFENRCCKTDQCNKDDITSSPSSQANGVECPACYNEKSLSCSSVTTIKCTGKETKCIEFSGSTLAGLSSLLLYGKGCATENACNMQQNVLNGIQIKTSCTSPVSNNGNPTLKLMSSFPIVLLLLKVLL
ncbi:protein RoBo-1 [Phodopus roborovskii]|uniref:LOC691352 protein n=1 Tax=Phodopus roborovskii TaxID=109678 RepID=A0AAU9Z267_PHORO|nr:protein RoBo-1 [Phodopus roborovskii]XP_051037492.1 protein RoBo-1 [Phodopus roborovskii]CAH6786297.1 LOC691352 [Phodopus roborovskii]